MDFHELNKKINYLDKSLNKISENKDLLFEFEVANLITEARYFSGLTQKDLADLIGTQQPSIARIEKGQSLPSLSFLLRIAKAMGTYLIAPKFGFMDEKSQNQTTEFRLEGTKEFKASSFESPFVETSRGEFPIITI